MESETQTRRKRIDAKLRDAGWQIVPFKPHIDIAALTNHAIEEYSTANGPADYALVSSGQLLGAIEARKVTVGAKGVLVQAERYSKGVTDSPFNFDGYRVPLLYSTNGEIIYFHDVRNSLNTSRKIAHFHTPDALSEMLSSSVAEHSEWFTQNPNDHPKLRDYQRDANAAVEEAIRILLERPSGWSTEALKELKNKLTTSTPPFTIENLQNAHHLRYDKALVDFISMIKHAASEQNPLLTAAERAARAIEQISHGQEYAQEQQQWLHRIE